MQQRSRGLRGSRLAIVGLATLIVTGGVVLGIRAVPAPPTDLQRRVELLLYRPGVPEAVLTRGGAASHILLLTAIRASRQLGEGSALPAGTADLVESAFVAVGPDDDAFSFGALEDLLVLQGRGVLTDVNLPASLRTAIRTAAENDAGAAVSPDPNVAAERLVHIRAARLLGLADLPATDVAGWCALSDQALASARIDIAAVFAEVAGPDPSACAPFADLRRWSAAIEAAASIGIVDGMSFFAPTLLSDDRSQSLAEGTLHAMDQDVAAGNVSFRTLEVVTRLARRPVAYDGIPGIADFTRRQILLQGSVPDGMLVGDWDRIVTAGVSRLAGLEPDREVVAGLAEAPPSTPLGTDDAIGLLGAAALRPVTAMHLPPVTAAVVTEAASTPGVLAAVTLRSGDCAYVGAADLSESVGDAPAPDRLVLYGLAARAAETCALDVSVVQRQRAEVLDAAARATSGDAAEQWAAAEVHCVLGVGLSQQARSAGAAASSAYIHAVIGPSPYPAYSSDALYAALRLGELSANGCDGRGWWTGLYGAT